jgi:hypothetical protein
MFERCSPKSLATSAAVLDPSRTVRITSCCWSGLSFAGSSYLRCFCPTPRKDKIKVLSTALFSCRRDPRGGRPRRFPSCRLPCRGFHVHISRSVTAFRSEIGQKNLAGLSTNLRQIQGSTTTNAQYQRALAQFRRRPDPPGQVSIGSAAITSAT